MELNHHKLPIMLYRTKNRIDNFHISQSISLTQVLVGSNQPIRLNTSV